jgi:hypothetical protein
MAALRAISGYRAFLHIHILYRLGLDVAVQWSCLPRTQPTVARAS